MKYEVGDTVFFLESNRFVRKATVTKRSGDFYTLRFEDGGGIRLRENRLYATQEAAEGNIPQRESEKQEKGNRSPYSWLH